MLKLTKTGIGLLTRQYRSVLKKCWAINVGVFALGTMAATVPNEANAEDATSRLVVNSGQTVTTSDDYKNFSATDLNGVAINNEGTLTITGGLYSGNTTNSTGVAINGGAIYNNGTLTITGGTFQSNTITSSSTTRKNFAYGAAISSLNKQINISNASVIGNKIESVGAHSWGAGVISYASPTVKNVNFENNSITTNTGTARAAAFLGVNATIENSTFKNNSVTGKSGSDWGISAGAAWLEKTATVKNSFFIGNSANGPSSYGGAIFVAGATIDFYDSTFENNTAYYGGAIFSPNANSVLNFHGTNTFTNNKGNVSTTSLNDIYLRARSTVNIIDGTTTLNSGFQGYSSAPLNINSYATLNLNENNGTIRRSTLGKVTNNGTFNLKIDMNHSNKTADTFVISSGSSGSIIINEIKESGTRPTTTTSYAVLSGSGMTLSLTQAVINAFASSGYAGTGTRQQDVKATTSWTETYYNQAYDITRKTNLSVSGNNLQYTVSDTNSNYRNISDVGDTLAYVNKATNRTNKNFNASSYSSTYTAGVTPGATSGTVNINGVMSGSNRSALDLGGYAGFSLDGSDIVNLSNMRLYGANSYTANLASANSKLTLNNTVLDGAEVKGSGMVELTGTNTVNAPLNNTGTTTVVSGTTDFNSTVAGFTNNGTVNVDASNITDEVTNNGTLNLSSGTLNYALTNTDTVNNSATINATITNSGTLDNNGTLSGTVNNSGTLMTKADALTGSSVTNNGTLELEGGNLTTSLLGTGRMKLMSGGVRLLATTPSATTGSLSFGNSNDYVNGIAATKAEIVSGDQYDIVTAAAVRDYISEYGGGSSIDVDTTFNKTSTNPATSTAIANYLDNNYYRKNKKSEILDRFEEGKIGNEIGDNFSKFRADNDNFATKNDNFASKNGDFVLKNDNFVAKNLSRFGAFAKCGKACPRLSERKGVTANSVPVLNHQNIASVDAGTSLPFRRKNRDVMDNFSKCHASNDNFTILTNDSNDDTNKKANTFAIFAKVPVAELRFSIANETSKEFAKMLHNSPTGEGTSLNIRRKFNDVLDNFYKNSKCLKASNDNFATTTFLRAI